MDKSYVDCLPYKIIEVEPVYHVIYSTCCLLCDLSVIERILHYYNVHVDASMLKKLPVPDVKALILDDAFAAEKSLFVPVPGHNELGFEIDYSVIQSIAICYKKDLDSSKDFIKLTPANLQIKARDYINLCVSSILYSLKHYGKFLSKEIKNNLTNWIIYLQKVDTELQQSVKDCSMLLPDLLQAADKKNEESKEDEESNIAQMDLFGSSEKFRFRSDMPWETFIVDLARESGNPDAINPGALTVLNAIDRNDPIFAPQNSAHIMQFFDEVQIYGSQIWCLVKDCLGSSLVNLSIMFQMYKHGDLSKDKIKESLSKSEKIDVKLEESFRKYGILTPTYDYNIEIEKRVPFSFEAKSNTELKAAALEGFFGFLNGYTSDFKIQDSVDNDEHKPSNGFDLNF